MKVQVACSIQRFFPEYEPCDSLEADIVLKGPPSLGLFVVYDHCVLLIK